MTCCLIVESGRLLVFPSQPSDFRFLWARTLTDIRSRVAWEEPLVLHHVALMTQAVLKPLMCFWSLCERALRCLDPGLEGFQAPVPLMSPFRHTWLDTQ